LGLDSLSSKAETTEVRPAAEAKCKGDLVPEATLTSAPALIRKTEENSSFFWRKGRVVGGKEDES